MANLTVTRKWNGNDVKVRGKNATGKSVWEIGLIVEGQARLLAARKTGRMAGSITTQTRTQGSSTEPPATSSDTVSKPNEDMVALVGTNVEYAPYKEFGTIRTDAQPFLRPALDLARGRALTIVENNGRMQFREYLQ